MNDSESPSRLIYAAADDDDSIFFDARRRRGYETMVTIWLQSQTLEKFAARGARAPRFSHTRTGIQVKWKLY